MANHRCQCVLIAVTVIASTVAADESGGRAEVAAGVAKSVTAAKTAIMGGVPDVAGETYGVVGVSNSSDGAGVGAANTNGGPDLVLDGSEDGEADAIISQAGIDRISGTTQTFTLHNSGAGRLDLYVDGILFGDGAGLTSVNASLLDGHTPGEFALDVDLATSGSSSVHWDNLTDVPPDLSNGDDDTLGDLACADEQIVRWTGSSWACSDDPGVEYSRTLVVGPIGTPAENGTLLLDALANIPTPASQAEAWLLKVEPGTYDVGTASFEMKSWVDVEGSGQEVTLIIGSVCEASMAAPTTGVVVGAGHAELRLLTVQNTCVGSGQRSVAIYNSDNWSRFDRVTVLASGAADDNFGVFNEGNDVELSHMTVVASGALESHYGLYSSSGARFRVSRSSFFASGGVFSTGVDLDGDDLVLDNVKTAAANATTDNFGVYVSGSDASVLTNVTATASGGTNATAVRASGSSIRIEGGIADGKNGVRVEVLLGGAHMAVLDHVAVNAAESGLESEAALFPPGSSLDVMVNNSSIRGVTNSIDNSSANVFVGGTQLAGGAVTGGGVTCAGVWDESYTFYPSTCP